MEEEQTRWWYFLKNFNRLNTKQVLLKQTWLEIFLTLLFLITLVLILIFTSWNWIVKVILIFVTLFLISTWSVKIKDLNFWIWLKMRFQLLLTQHDLKNFTYQQSCLTHLVKINCNDEWIVKRLHFTRLVSELDLVQIQGFIFDETNILNCFILGFNQSEILNFYNHKLSQLIKNNKNKDERFYLIYHQTETEFFDQNNTQKVFYLFSQKETDLDFLKKYHFIKTDELSTDEVNWLKEKYLHLFYTKKPLKLHKTYFKQDQKYYCSINLTNYHTNYTWSWLNNFINLSKYSVICKLRALNQNESCELIKYSIDNDFLTIKKNKNYAWKKQNEFLKNCQIDIKKNHNCLVELNCCILLQANNLKSLKQQQKEVIAQLALYKFKTKIFMHESYLSYCLTLWKQHDYSYYFGWYVTLFHLYVGLFNASQTYQMQEGIYLGNQAASAFLFDQTIFLKNQSDYFNGLALILGKSGSGKSLLIKKLIYLSILVQHQKIIVFDVEDEYSILKQVLSNNVTILLHQMPIDPFSFQFENFGERLMFLSTFFAILHLQNKDCQEVLNDFLKEISQPTFWSFITYLKKQKSEIYEQFKYLDNETFRKEWFKQNEIDWNNYDLVILNFKELFVNEILSQNNLILASYILVMTKLSQLVFYNQTTILNLVVDEAHKFFQFKNELIDHIWFSLIKKARKNRCLLTFCTQNYRDLQLNQYATKIMENTQYLFVAHLNDGDLNALIKDLNLSQFNLKKIQNSVSNLQKGEFLFSYNQQTFFRFQNNLIDLSYLQFYEKKKQSTT